MRYPVVAQLGQKIQSIQTNLNIESRHYHSLQTNFNNQPRTIMNYPQQFPSNPNSNTDMHSADFTSNLKSSANNYTHSQSTINNIQSPINNFASNIGYNQTMQGNPKIMQGQENQSNQFSQGQTNMPYLSQFNSQNGISSPSFHSNFQIDPNQFKPYEKQEFLDNVFHFNDHYIEAFHTLPHQTKLKFYLYVEEVKMLGKMTNREDYQTILKEIARRVVFLHPESQLAKQIQEKHENQEQMRKKQWMNKMENLVEGHLMKIQKDDFLDDLPITSPTFSRQTNEKKKLTQDFLSDDNYLETELKRQEPSLPYNSLGQNAHIPQSLQTGLSQKINNDDDDEEFEWSEPATPTQGIYSSMPVVQQTPKPRQDQQQWEWNEEDSSVPQNQFYTNKNENYFPTAYEKPMPQQKREVIDVWDIAVEEYSPERSQKIESFSNRDNTSISNSNQTNNLQNEGNNNVFSDQNQIILMKHSYSGQENQFVQNFDDYPKEPLSATVQHSSMGMDFMDIDFNGEYNENAARIQDIEMYRQQSYSSQNAMDFRIHSVNIVHNQHKLTEEIPQKVGVGDEDQWGEMQGQENPTIKPISIPMQQPQYFHTDTFLSGQMDPYSSNSAQNYSYAQQASQSYNVGTSQKITDLYAHSVQEGNIQDNDDGDFEWQESKQQEREASNSHNINNDYQNSSTKQQEPFVWDQSPAITNSQFNISHSVYPTTISNPVPLTDDDIFSTDLFQFSSPTPITLQQPITNEELEENIDENEEIYSSNSLMTHDNSQYENDETLQNLKIQYFSQTCQQIQKFLNVNGFEYQRDFYPQALQLISSLFPLSALKQCKDYEIITSQQKICEQIFRLTELYTAAVEEDQQEKVISTLKESKELHKKISPTIIKKVLNKFLKMKGMGINFQIGRLGLQAGIPRVLIEKCVGKGLHKFKETMAVLYVLDYLGNIHSTPVYVGSLIEYLQHKLEEMGDIGYKLGMISSDTGSNHEFNDLKVKQFVKNNEKFIEYKKSLALISIITKRMIVLGKLCLSSGELHPNLLKLHKKIRDISSAIGSALRQHTTIQDDDIIIPHSYVETFENVAALYSKATVYELYAQFMTNMQTNPICCLCLLSAEWEDQTELGLSGKQSDDKVYHFSCWNLQIAVRRYKQSKSENIQQLSPKEQKQIQEKTPQEGKQITNRQIPSIQQDKFEESSVQNNGDDNTQSMPVEDDQFEQEWH